MTEPKIDPKEIAIELANAIIAYQRGEYSIQILCEMAKIALKKVTS